MKVLIVEDERKVGRFIEQALTEQSHTAQLVGSCAAARDALAESGHDLVILDLGLPDGDGFDLLREWRSAGFNEPVLILSAREAVEDRIRGLNLGADDYLAKPFSLEELLARVRALLRRQTGAKATVLEHAGVRMDLLTRSVSTAAGPVALTSREFALLELFLQNKGRVLTRSLIAERIWEAHYDMETNLIDVYVRRLRQKLGATEEQPFIRTLRGTGYQLS
ncbi:Transcriptional regulatory protein CusR [Lacunisphaera limnophila]|uniref:Transcriptional regulatory protein CusR n=1 Tax=Lacunisphaera limnophila TaxID=1838286 RepID=A0A1D8ATA7_9BACT|nr:response regulator transcription factor [Lacunisphaera limnophila]AOS44127.1 Transcriptional regulatory protein CusR [Lacunisphaera limnophila]